MFELTIKTDDLRLEYQQDILDIEFAVELIRLIGQGKTIGGFTENKFKISPSFPRDVRYTPDFYDDAATPGLRGVPISTFSDGLVINNKVSEVPIEVDVAPKEVEIVPENPEKEPITDEVELAIPRRGTKVKVNLMCSSCGVSKEVYNRYGSRWTKRPGCDIKLFNAHASDEGYGHADKRGNYYLAHDIFQDRVDRESMKQLMKDMQKETEDERD